HTRSKRDWSSDVCSSDLLAACSEDKKEQTNQTDDSEEVEETEEAEETEEDANEETQDQEEGSIEDQRDLTIKETGTFQSTLGTRSEERRVGKEWRWRKEQ